MKRIRILVILLLSIPTPRAFAQETGEVRSRFDPALLSLISSVPMSTNPAALLFDETVNVIRIGPNLTTSSGSYRRLFDPEEVQRYSVGGSVVNILGNRGTFRGSASYVYEDRKRILAALRLNPYAGDGFVAIDTSRGDFRYMGPRVEVEYAYELMSNLSIGFLTSYEVLDGLKGYYSHAHTTFRDILYGFGLQYAFDQTSRIGTVVRGIDQQEKIESKSSDDLMDVEIFSYRGDSYATKRRSNAVKETYRVHGWEILGEMRIDLFPGLVASGRGSLREVGLWSLFPSGLTQEFEDGYAQQRRMTGEANFTYQLTTDLALTGGVEGCKYESWSKVSSRSLLMWEWDYYHFDGSLGIVASLSEKLQFFGEGRIRTGHIDSLKYIDARRSSHALGGSGGLVRIAYAWNEEWRVTLSGWMKRADVDVMMGGVDALHAGVLSVIAWKASPRFEVEIGIGWQRSSGTVARRELERIGQTYSLVLHIPQD